MQLWGLEIYRYLARGGKKKTNHQKTQPKIIKWENPASKSSFFFFYSLPLFCGAAAFLLYFHLGVEEEEPSMEVEKSSMKVSDSKGHFVCWTKPPQH